MQPSYERLSSHEDEILLGQPSNAVEKYQQQEHSSSTKPYVLYLFLAVVLVLNIATFAKTLSIQADTLSSITQARDIESLPRPDPYVGLPLKTCKRSPP
jgi:hypothetical protein